MERQHNRVRGAPAVRATRAAMHLAVSRQRGALSTSPSFRGPRQQNFFLKCLLKTGLRVQTLATVKMFLTNHERMGSEALASMIGGIIVFS